MEHGNAVAPGRLFHLTECEFPQSGRIMDHMLEAGGLKSVGETERSHREHRVAELQQAHCRRAADPFPALLRLRAHLGVRCFLSSLHND